MMQHSDCQLCAITIESDTTGFRVTQMSYRSLGYFGVKLVDVSSESFPPNLMHYHLNNTLIHTLIRRAEA